MAEDVQTTVPDYSKGSVLPTGDGGVTLDAGNESRDAVPSPVENRDTIRNSDDTNSSDTSTGVALTDQEKLLRSTWQVGNFDSSTGPGADLLQNLAYPSEMAVRAEQKSDARTQSGTQIVGGAEDSDAQNPVTEKHVVSDSGTESESGVSSTEAKEPVEGDTNGDGVVDDKDLSPQQRAARTKKLNAEKAAAEEAAAKEAAASGDGSTSA